MSPSVPSLLGELEKKVPVVRDVDVVVAGAGVSGVFAALAAAKYDAKTVLIDRFGTIGGNIGSAMIFGCVNPYLEAPMCQPSGLVGIPKEFSDRAEALRDGMPPIQPVFSNCFSRAAIELMEKYSVEPILSAYAADPIVHDGTVSGLFVETKSGRIAVKAKVVIDDTGEADIARRAGAPVTRHVKADPSFPPVIANSYNQERYENWNECGLVFVIAGVKWQEYEVFIGNEPKVVPEGFPIHGHPFMYRYPKNMIPLLRVAWEKGDFYFARNVDSRATIFWQPGFGEKEGFFKIGDEVAEGFTSIYGDFDTDDWEHISFIETELRRQAFDTVIFLRKYVPGFQNSYLLFTNPFIGARGGAYIEGEYVITPDDIIKGRRFDDVVVRDIFDSKRLAPNPRATLRTKDGYDLPYRMLLPKKIDGLLVTGRGSSYIRRGHDPSTRARSTQMHLGQVAGTGAALAVKDRVAVRNIDVKKLQRELLRQGFYLGDEDRLKELDLA